MKKTKNDLEDFLKDSLKDALVFVLIVALIIGLVAGLFSGLVAVFVDALIIGLVAVFVDALAVGLIIGLFVGFVAYSTFSPDFLSFDFFSFLIGLIIIQSIGWTIVSKSQKK